MLTPEEQLNSAVQGLEQSQQAPVLQSHMMNRGYEQAGIGVASGIAQAPNVVAMGTGIGIGVAGMLSTSAGLDRALGFFDPFTGAMGRHMVGKTLARRLISAVPGGAFMMGTTMAASYAANRMVEGQQEYVAARQLLRELPMMTGGLGSVSVLGSPNQSTLNNASTSYSTVNRFASSINAIGAGAGMDSAMTRNTLSSMAQNGQIDSSSVESVSRSFREGLQTLQRLQKVLQTDLQTASNVYSNMRAGGLSNDQAIAGLRRSGALSAMSGVGLSGVSQLISNGAQTSVSSGMSALLGSNVAMNSLSSAAMMQSNGLLPSSYLQRAGGSIDAVASRMTELQLGVGSSQGAMALMSSMYNPDGSRRSGSRLFSADRLQASNSFMRDLNPYEMADMQEGLVRSQASTVLGRVSAIRANARNSTQADRRQFEFLSTLGIEDPTEQRVYLDSLRNQGASQFTAAMQETRNTLITSADPTAGTRAEMIKFSDLMSVMTHGMATNLRTFGRSMLQASEAVIRDLTEGSRMAVHLNTGGATLASVQQARNDILSGSGAASIMPIREYADQLSQGGMQRILRGSNFTGVRPNSDVRSRLPALARAYIGLAVDLPQMIRSSIVGIGQTAYGSDRPYNTTYGIDAENFTDFARNMNYMSSSSEGGAEVTANEYLGVLALNAGERYNPETGSLVRTDEREVDRIMNRRGEAITRVGSQQAERLYRNASVMIDPSLGFMGNSIGFLEGRTGMRSLTQNLLDATYNYIEQERVDYWNSPRDPNFAMNALRSLNDGSMSLVKRTAGAFLYAGLTLPHGLAMGGDAIYSLGASAVDATTSGINAALGQENDYTLSESMITAIQNNSGQQGRILDSYAEELFPGKKWRDLTAQQQANLEGAISRANPDMATALNITSGGGMSDEQFMVFATGTEFTNTLTSVFSGTGAIGSSDSRVNGQLVGGGEDFVNTGRISGRNISTEELEQNSDYYVGNLQAMALVAQNPSNPGSAINAVTGSIVSGTNTYGNFASENAALINIARLDMPDVAEAELDQNVDKDALVARTERLLRESGMSGSQLIARMAQIRTQVASAPEVTNRENRRERENIRAADPRVLATTAADSVIQQRNLGYNTFVAARNAVNEQNVQYLRDQYRDSITTLVSTDTTLMGILGANTPTETNDIFDIIKANADAPRIFASRIDTARQQLREALQRGDTAEATRLEAEIDVFETARSVAGAGGTNESSTDIVTGFAMSRIFGADGRISEAGVAEASTVANLPGISSMVSLLSDTQGGVTRQQRNQFRGGLQEIGFIGADGEITDTLRDFARNNAIDLGTGSTEESLKRFEDQLRENSDLQQVLVKNVAESGPGVVTSSTEEANDRENMRTAVRQLNQVLPSLITALADPDRGMRVHNAEP